MDDIELNKTITDKEFRDQMKEYNILVIVRAKIKIAFDR